MTDADILSPPEVTLPARPMTKFERERAAFQRLLPELLKEYRNRYVAIHEECVVGSGDDILQVAHAAYQQYGYQPIYVDLVTDEQQPLPRIPSARNTCNRLP